VKHVQERKDALQLRVALAAQQQQTRLHEVDEDGDASGGGGRAGHQMQSQHADEGDQHEDE
jgi:hypothetical protein